MVGKAGTVEMEDVVSTEVEEEGIREVSQRVTRQLSRLVGAGDAVACTIHLRSVP